MLAAGLATVAEKERSPQDLVTRLGKGLKETLTDRLAERGLVHRQDGRMLGVFPRTRWPAADATHEREVLGLPAREVKKRAKAIGEGDWAVKAVRDAVAATVAAVTAAGAAVTFAAAGS